MTVLDSRVLLAPDDGSLGPLLRLTDDRLGPGAGYGRHPHAAVDVVAVVLAGWALGLGWTLLVALVFGALPGHRAALGRGRP